MRWGKPDFGKFLWKPRSVLAELWSTVEFARGDYTDFARVQMEEETRSGVRTLAALFLVPMLCTGLFAPKLGLDWRYVYGFLALAGLAMHVYVSSRAVREIEALYLLGMVLLVVSGTTFVLMAHSTGALGSVIFASVGLLFMSIPTVPWGLREGAISAAMIYGVFTASTWSVADRFPPETLWTLQLFMAAAAAVSTTLVARNALVRKRDIRLRFDLEQAHDELEVLSLQDSLTGVWNRRYLESELQAWSEPEARKGYAARFGLVDLDFFKQLNDRYGHGYGDQTLCWVARALEHAVGRGFVARIGGDEFACLMVSEDPEVDLEPAIDALEHIFRTSGELDRKMPTFSAGVVEIPPHRSCSLSEIYKAADNALYEAKRERGSETRSCTVVTLCLDAVGDEHPT